MYDYYPVTGAVQQLTNEEAHKKMNKISSQWEDETTPLGKLFMGVYDWAYTSTDNNGVHFMNTDIPNLRTGGSIPENVNASRVFGFIIYGDCFLKKIRTVDEVTSELNQAKDKLANEGKPGGFIDKKFIDQIARLEKELKDLQQD